MTDARRRRQYSTTPLPTMRAGGDAAVNREILLAIYTEANSNWRQLVDICFRLLALVPGASILVAALLAGSVDGLQAASRFVVLLLSLAGVAAVAGLWLYDRRNDALHDDLISRARKIEQELGLDTGVFLGRKMSTSRLVQHGTAKAIVYLSAGSAWLVVLIAVSMGGQAATEPTAAGRSPIAADMARADSGTP